jgi:beta-xylosidase
MFKHLHAQASTQIHVRIAVSLPLLLRTERRAACICVDKTFYLVCSSFLFYPGIPVYTSKDLQNWTQIGELPLLTDVYFPAFSTICI